MPFSYIICQLMFRRFYWRNTNESIHKEFILNNVQQQVFFVELTEIERLLYRQIKTNRCTMIIPQVFLTLLVTAAKVCFSPLRASMGIFHHEGEIRSLNHLRLICTAFAEVLTTYCFISNK